MPESLITRVQVKLVKGGHAYRFGTVNPDGLKVRFKQRLRRTGDSIPGLGPIVESAGLDKSTVSLSAEREQSHDGWGGRYAQLPSTFRLLDRNKFIRRLNDDDLRRIEEINAEIQAVKDQLKAVQRKRRAALEEAWGRAGKIEISLLEEKAKS